MTNTDAPLTALGNALEEARETLDLSKREAARRSGISEGRWRQIVSGFQRPGSGPAAGRPRRSTVIAMARAVGLDESKALRLAGYAPLPEVSEPEPMSPEVIQAWGREMLAEIWRHPRLTDDQKERMTAETTAEIGRLLAKAERLRRTA